MPSCLSRHGLAARSRSATRRSRPAPFQRGIRACLALDADGRPRIAYDANHEQGGACGTFTDTKLTRFVQFNP
jgi:hypothetical protein